MLVFEPYYTGVCRKTAFEIREQVGNKKVGDIYQDHDGYFISTYFGECIACRHRQIADRLDELNKL